MTSSEITFFLLGLGCGIALTGAALWAMASLFDWAMEPVYGKGPRR